MKKIEEILTKYEYPGRGILIGLNEFGTEIFLAYFIMGRSENSKNRVFELDEEKNLKTKPFKKENLKNEELIIYTAVTKFNGNIIVSNGNHTETIVKGLKNGLSFKESLKNTNFEPDPPILTPRISAILNITSKKISYTFSIIKNYGNSKNCTGRFFFEYENITPATGHLIHTYKPKNNNITNSFFGEPKLIKIPKNLNNFTESLWQALNEKNRISLFARSINLKTKEEKTKIININN